MIGAKKRFKVLERDGFRCQYCWKNGKDVSLEVDHIIPKAKWGTDDFDNLITCCRECNIWKGNEIVWMPINIWKLKITEHESKTFKWFFSERNELGYWSIEKRNLSYISWFIKLYYSDFYKWYLPYLIKAEEITQVEFEEWGEKSEKALNEFDDIVQDDLMYILNNLENENREYVTYRTRATDDYNERLNWLITYQIAQLSLPKSLAYKYSVCPHKVEERLREDDE